MSGKRNTTRPHLLRPLALDSRGSALPGEGPAASGPAESGGPDGGKARRTVLKSVRFSPRELKRVEERARVCGLSTSAFLRAVALGRTVRARPGQLERDLLYQLSRIGNNLKQLARVAGACGEEALERELLSAVAAVREEMGRLGR